MKYNWDSNEKTKYSTFIIVNIQKSHGNIFATNSSDNIKLSKAQLSKIVEAG